MPQPTRSNQRGARRTRKEIKSSSKKCNKKVESFTGKKAMINDQQRPAQYDYGNSFKSLEQIQDRIKHRHQQLQRLQNWCMDRISHLSLHQSIEDATALTAEHLELLKSIDQAETLWMGNNNSSNSHQEMTN